MTRKKKTAKQKLSSSRLTNTSKVPFIEHFYELRKRVFFIAIAVIGWSIAAYSVEQHVINVLLAPAHGQDFIYTSPVGGMNFLFRVCLYVGLAFSIPVIIYQFLRYIEPLMQASSARFIQYGSVASGVLAIAGMLFGYYLGLPAALHFLLNQFVTKQIHPLLTIDSYLSFVAVYMLGAALMFQIPLIVLFINRIKPLTPKMLFSKERWVILVSVVLAMIMNPTPNVIDQLFVAGPIILSYQVSIAIIWWTNRWQKIGRRGRIAELRARDEKERQARMARVQELKQTWQFASDIAEHPETTTKTVAAFAREQNKQVRQVSSKIRIPVREVVPTKPPAYAKRTAEGGLNRARLVQ